MKHDENAARARLIGKFDAIANAGNPKKHELQSTVGFFNVQVTKLQALRHRENASLGRNNADDDILDILELMETRCLKMGCLPDPRGY